MPKYRVQLKQGSRTIVNHIEAKDMTSVLAFYNAISTMQVTEVLKIEYENDTTPPIDDMLYHPLFKGIMKTDTRLCKQIIVNNVKLGVTEKDIAAACRNFLEINGVHVDSLYSALFKSKN